jgi:hypothetical protein
MPLDEVTAILRQRDGALSLVQRDSLDESLSFEMPKVRPLLARILQIPFGHHPKRANGRERPGFRAVEGVVPVSVVDQLALPAVWQVQVAHEHIARVEASAVIVAVPRLAVALLTPLLVAVPRFMLDSLVASSAEIVLPPEHQPLILSVVNAIVPLARIEVAGIEIACHRNLPRTSPIGTSRKSR